MPILLVWWRQTPKDSTRRPFRSLQKIGLEVPTSCLGASLWYPGTGRLLLSATSIMHGRFYILLLQTTQGAQRLVFPINLSILTNLLMLPFALLVVPLLCQKNLLLMSLNPTTNQDSLIWHCRSGGLLNLVGCGYVLQLLWEWLLLIFWKIFVMGLRENTMTNSLVSENSWNDLLKIASKIFFLLEKGHWKNNLTPPWWCQWFRYSFYLPCASIF